MDNEYELIEQYLLGRLNDQQRQSVEAQLASDPAFAAAFRQQQLEHQTLELLLEQELRAKMSNWSSHQPPDDIPAPYWSLAVGTLALFLGTVLYYNWPQAQPAPATPAIEYHTPAPAPLARHNPPVQHTPETDRKTANSSPRKIIALAKKQYDDTIIRAQRRGDAALAQLNQWYAEKNFMAVLAATDHLEVKSPTFLTQTELRAHALFQLGQYAAAGAAFKVLIESQKEPFAERSEWFLLLAYMAQNKEKEALAQREYLLRTPEHAYFEQAKRVAIGE